MSSHTKEHLEAALTWIERNTHDGIRIVAGALAATYPDEEPPEAPPVPPAVTIDNVAVVRADEINAQFPGAEVVVLVIAQGDDLIRAGASVPDQSPERVKEILSRAAELLRAPSETTEKQG